MTTPAIEMATPAIEMVNSHKQNKTKKSELWATEYT